ncbi:hypothetical protein ACHAQG_006533 [Verticillium nonalfalfae]
MGKVYRLEKEPELALAFWNAGIEVGAKEGHGGSAKLKQLFDARAPLQKRYGRKDPMELPLEIVDNIFSHLDFRELWYVSSLIGVAKSTPNLQQLHLTNYLLRNNQEFDEGEFWSMWSKLEAVVVEHQILGPITDHTNRRIFPPLRSLRAFESRTLAPAMQPVPFPHSLLIDYGNNPPSDDPSASHDHLQRFWVEGVSITPALQAILEPAIQSGSLRELALCFPDHRSPDWGSVDQPAQAFLEQIPWLYGVESVRTLGLFDFNLDTNLSLPDVVQSPAGAPRRLPERDQAKLLVKFIETFPNLETLVLASSLCESRPIAVITEAVARQGKVKKFYVQGLMGALLDHMRAFGEEKGVEILHHREVSPWPVPLEDRDKA